jgi:hypothetical protein
MAITAAILYTLAGVSICILANLSVDLLRIVDGDSPLPDSQFRNGVYIILWPTVAIAAIIGYTRSDYK